MPEAPIVVVPLANGFEEIEAVTIIDVLRRAGARVLVAGLDAGTAHGSHGIDILPEVGIDQLGVDPAEIDLVVLPGGMPGAKFLADDARVQSLLRSQIEHGHRVAAICAAPMALAAISADRAITCFPGMEGRCVAREIREERVVIDGPVITSRGAGSAMEFALVLVEELFGAEAATRLAETMLVPAPAPAYRV